MVAARAAGTVLAASPAGAARRPGWMLPKRHRVAGDGPRAGPGTGRPDTPGCPEIAREAPADQ